MKRTLAALIAILFLATNSVAIAYELVDASCAPGEIVSSWCMIPTEYAALWAPPVVEAFHSPTQKGMGSDVEQWRPLVAKYFQPADVDLALRVMGCESGGNPWAKNPRSSASGLYQHIMRYWPSRAAGAGFPGGSVWDPETNIAASAYLFYSAGSWRDWRASVECWS